MRIKSILFFLTLVLCSVYAVNAQQTTSTQETNEQRVPLAEQATALDAKGALALGARLRTTALNGAPDAPVTNVRFVVENRSQYFYNYVNGWATFYDAAGVRCGEGLFKLDALAVGESAETDTPGLRITCAPAAWRIVATTLLTRTTDTAKPNEPAPVEPSGSAATPREEASQTAADNAQPGAQSFINLNIDGRDYSVAPGGTLDLPVRRNRVKIIVGQKPQ
ncbi:MAG: hypothetical protein WBP93_06670 [Pyrinomonadaceae bacterium]